VGVAATSAVVAAAIPTHHVEDRGVFFAEPPTKIDRSPGIDLFVDGHRITVGPPPGYVLTQVGEGDASHAHVTFSPVGPGEQITVRFAVPDGIRPGAIVGTRDGNPIRDSRFGVLWTSQQGVRVLVTGAGLAARIAVVEALDIDA
jgi:hypothetical protein